MEFLKKAMKGVGRRNPLFVVEPSEEYRPRIMNPNISMKERNQLFIEDRHNTYKKVKKEMESNNRVFQDRSFLSGLAYRLANGEYFETLDVEFDNVLKMYGCKDVHDLNKLMKIILLEMDMATYKKRIGEPQDVMEMANNVLVANRMKAYRTICKRYGIEYVSIDATRDIKEMLGSVFDIVIRTY